MKVVQVTTSSKGGAGIAALRLHRALREQGVASAFLSKDLCIDFNNRTFDNTFFKYKKPSFLKLLLLKLQRKFFPTFHQKVTTKLARLKPKLNFENLTIPCSHFDLESHPLVSEADILNLHWVGGLIDYERFFSHIKKPVVWTLHDMNPFSGIFHYRTDEKRNKAVAEEFSDHILQYKITTLKKIRNGALISPSKWLLNEAVNGKVFAHFNPKICIPNAIDLDLFNVQDPNPFRLKHGIGTDEFVLLFISHSLDIKRKGLDLLMAALERLSQFPITLLTVGKGEAKLLGTHIKIISLGKINSQEEMASCYAMANGFMIPSREDNLPNVMLESLACGTPVIAFPVGGMLEHIKEGVTGSLAKEVSDEALAGAIQHFYKTRNAYQTDVVRAYAEEHFSFKNQANSYKGVYDELLK
jgi:glycosyltransferase involved in cell wall biosynthesis